MVFSVQPPCNFRRSERLGPDKLHGAAQTLKMILTGHKATGLEVKAGPVTGTNHVDIEGFYFFQTLEVLTEMPVLYFEV